MGNTGNVYTIINKVTGHIYVGETKRDLELRFKERKLALKKGRERNKHLQKEFNEYGGENFIYEPAIITKEYKLCELVLIELFGRLNIGFEQRRGCNIYSVINNESEIPKEVFHQIEFYFEQKFGETSNYLPLMNELRDMKENGFICKTNGIYNMDFKNLFLEQYNHKTRRVYEDIFSTSGKVEELLEKDLYDFSFEEAEELLYSLNRKSLRSMQNHISRLRKYLEFAIQQGYSANQHNYYIKSKRINVIKYIRGEKDTSDK